MSESDDADQATLTEDTTSKDSTAITLHKETIKIIGVTLAAVLLFLLLAITITKRAQDVNSTDAFASVNGENLTEQDVEERRVLLSVLGQPTGSTDQLKEQLIDEILLLQEARQRNLVPGRANASREIDGLLAQNDLNRSTLEQRLSAEGITWEDFLTFYANRQAMNNVVEALQSNNTITEDELRDHYEANKETYQVGRTAEVRHILITPAGTENSTPEALAQNVLEQVNNGSDFCRLVQRYSDDPGSRDTCGAYNVTRKDQFVQPFIDAAFNMSTNETRLVNSSFGYHVMQKTAEHQPRTPSFDDVKDRIRDQMERQQRITRISRVIDDLRENATITIYEDSLRNQTERGQTTNQATNTGGDEPNESDEDNTTEVKNTTAEQNTSVEAANTTEAPTTTTSQSLSGCLDSANATLYTVSWGPHSEDQLDELGEATEAVTVTQCDAQNTSCPDLATYPTWELNGERHDGFKTRTRLNAILGC